MRAIAPAKLNLFLHVTGKRPDGYHLLESLIVFTAFGDVLTFEKADTLSLAISGPHAQGLDSEHNLVMNAARLLQTRTGYKGGARITLEKNIPVGAGLGGGSSDAGVALKALVELWKLLITDAELHKLALTLGADVPVCLIRKPALISGIGEHITPVSLKPELHVVLVNRGKPLLTADVFKKYSGAFSATKKMPGKLDTLEAAIAAITPMQNDLEAPAVSLMPDIGIMLKDLRAQKSCMLARMSGSGATCFGLFENSSDAAAAQQALAKTYAWSVATTI